MSSARTQMSTHLFSSFDSQPMILIEGLRNRLISNEEFSKASHRHNQSSTLKFQ